MPSEGAERPQPLVRGGFREAAATAKYRALAVERRQEPATISSDQLMVLLVGERQHHLVPSAFPRPLGKQLAEQGVAKVVAKIGAMDGHLHFAADSQVGGKGWWGDGFDK